MKFNEDQIAQVLSALWIQASLPDNRPANIEAIAHSFCLTLISSDLRVCNRLKVFNFYCLFFPLVYKYIKGKRTGSFVFSSLLVLGFMSMQNLSSNLIVSFFHFPLAIMKMSVDPNQGKDYYIFYYIYSYWRTFFKCLIPLCRIFTSCISEITIRIISCNGDVCGKDLSDCGFN